MDRQAQRDWVHRFNAEGPDGLRNHLSDELKPRLTRRQVAELAQIVETGPGPKTDGVVLLAAHRSQCDDPPPLRR